MPKTKQQKQETIKSVIDSLKKQQAMVLFDFTGVDSKTLFDLRGNLKQAGCQLLVVKKTLLKKALEKMPFKGLADKLKEIKGQIAIIFGLEDETSPAKIFQQSAEKAENLVVLTGTLGEEILSALQVVELARLPGKQELLARLVGSLQAPIANYVYVLKGNIKGLLNVLAKAKT